jgi:hypothetical protein
MIKEIWKNIPNYEGYYQASNLGRIKSIERDILNRGKFPFKSKEKILKPQNDTRGYSCLNLFKNGKRKNIKVHKLIAMTFLNHIPNGKYDIVVDHINNDKLDNRVENLQLISNRENTTKIARGKSKYIGVIWQKKLNKWGARIRIEGKSIYLGVFDCEIQASEAYQNALKMYNNNDLSFMESKRKRNKLTKK